MHADDTQLLIRTSRGDEPAARALWDRYGPPLIAYARAVLGPSHAHYAEDVVQNVMCSILQTPVRSLRQARDVRAWLSTSTRRHSLNTLRSAGRAARRNESLAAGYTDRAAAPAAGSQPSPELARALESLPRRLREVVYLRHAAALSFDEISISLNRSRSTLSTQYQRALSLLRQMIDPATITPGRPSETSPALVPVSPAGA